MKRKPLIGQAGASGNWDARARRNAQASQNSANLKFPLRPNRRGQISHEIAGNSPFAVDPRRGLQFLVDEESGLEVSSGSPFMLRRIEGGNITTDPDTGALVAEPTIDQIRGDVGGDDLELTILRLQANKFDSADIESGTVTLVAGTSGAITSALVTSTQRPQFWRGTPGSTPTAGLYASAADIVDNTSFVITSTNAGDDGEVYWRIGP